MSDFTVEQLQSMIENLESMIESLKSMKKGTTEGPWFASTGSFGRVFSIGPIEQGFSGDGLECDVKDADLAAAAPSLVDESIRDKRALIAEKRALIAEKQETQRLREGIKELQELAVFGQGSADYDKFHAAIARIMEDSNG